MYIHVVMCFQGGQKGLAATLINTMNVKLKGQKIIQIFTVML